MKTFDINSQYLLVEYSIFSSVLLLVKERLSVPLLDDSFDREKGSFNFISVFDSNYLLQLFQSKESFIYEMNVDKGVENKDVSSIVKRAKKLLEEFIDKQREVDEKESDEYRKKPVLDKINMDKLYGFCMERFFSKLKTQHNIQSFMMEHNLIDRFKPTIVVKQIELQNDLPFIIGETNVIRKRLTE